MTDQGIVPRRRYRWLIRALSPLLLLWVAVVARRQKLSGDERRRFVRERLGHHTRTLPAQNDRRWIHAASVGEVITALPLIEAILESNEDVLVTTATPTGASVLRERLPRAHHAYLPIDLPGAVGRFLDRAKPVSGWIIETEIWPWLFSAAQSRAIPLSIVSARLSQRTLDGAARGLGPVYADALATVTILARSETDAQRYRQLGAPLVTVVSDLKHAGDVTREAPALPFKRTYHLCASTHDDEELQLARAWLDSDTDALLIIAPRHPERGDALAESLSALAQHPIARRSLAQIPGDTDRLYLADTLGEMPLWYSQAQTVFVGGSLIERGGHNLLEPARHARPVCTGPHTDNFLEATEALRAANALFQADDAAGLVDWMLHSEPDQHRAMGKRAAAQGSTGGEVLERYLDALSRPTKSGADQKA